MGRSLVFLNRRAPRLEKRLELVEDAAEIATVDLEGMTTSVSTLFGGQVALRERVLHIEDVSLPDI